MWFSRPDQKEIAKKGVLHALGAYGYVLAVVLFLSNAENIFGGGEETFVIPLMMLSLLVFSAAMMALLMFGRPVMWYLDGKKKEAVQLVCWTVGSFGALTIATIALVATGMR